jgi:hypothetical protein
MPQAALKPGDFYQWSAASPPRAVPAPDHKSRLTDRLDAKLAELVAAGYRLLWIGAPPEELATLFQEGGDEAIVMDPNPDCDVAWYASWEIRPTTAPGVRIYLEGEADEMSCHIV